MKRSFKDIEDTETYYPGTRKKQYAKTCAICKTPEDHLHRIVDEELSIINAQYGLSLKTGDRACCRHWQPHDNEVFRAKSRPSLLLGVTAYHTSRAQRKDPAPRVSNPSPPLDPSKMSHTQLLKHVAKMEEELEKAAAREEDLQQQLDELLERPYEPVFKLCEAKSDEGTRQLIGPNIILNFYNSI